MELLPSATGHESTASTKQCDEEGRGRRTTRDGERRTTTTNAALPRTDFLGELVESGRLVYIDSEDSGGKYYLALLGPISLPVAIATDSPGEGRKGSAVASSSSSSPFHWYIFSRFSSNDSSCFTAENPVSSILTYGLAPLGRRKVDDDVESSGWEEGAKKSTSTPLPLIRLHSGCHTGDVLGSMRCDCGPQFRAALKKIVENRCGALVYIASHEGRGIGLWAKALTYLLQDRGYDTFVANELLGFPPDARKYGDALAALKHVLPEGMRDVKLLSNNPAKRAEMEAGGFRVVEMLKLVVGVSNYNVNYLTSKRRRGHTISSTDLAVVAPTPPPHSSSSSPSRSASCSV